MDDMLNKIKNELSLEELGEIVKCGLSTIYRKLKDNEGFYAEIYCFVKSIGDEDYETEVVFINGDIYGNDINYITAYTI